jgi:MFS transporter, UMF1 family
MTRASTTSWVLYDMANTVFSFSIVSLFFPLYLKDHFGLPDSAFAIGNSAAIAVMLLLSPALGALSDKARRRVPFLVGSTLACVLAPFPLGFVPWPVALVLFAIANIGFLSGLIFYDALLPVVSTAANRGRIGAIGVAIGYLGSLVGLGLGRTILSGDESRDAWVFVTASLLFLLLATPAFFWIREPARAAQPLRAREVIQTTRASFRGVRRLLAGRDEPRIGRFLLSRVFYSDAVNTMILFMGIYVTGELGMTAGESSLVLLSGILGAASAAPMWGMLVDSLGAIRTLRIVLLCWLVGLAVVVAVPILGLASTWFFPTAAFLGACLGGTWSADRPLMVQLAPPERIGEYYGYYGMVGRFSAIAGPLIWALVVDVLRLGRPAAVATLMVFVLVALYVLRGLDAGIVDPPPAPAPA